MKKEENKIGWLVWSIDFKAWSLGKMKGYTTDIKKAHRFGYHEARGLVWDHNYGAYEKPVLTMVQDYIGKAL